MKKLTLALSMAVAAAGITAGQAFAQDREVTITHDTPDGAVVTKHIRRSDDGVVHRTVRVQRPDGSTMIRRTTRYGDGGYVTPHRTVVIHRKVEPQRVVVVHEHHAHVAPRRVTVIRDEG